MKPPSRSTAPSRTTCDTSRRCSTRSRTSTTGRWARCSKMVLSGGGKRMRPALALLAGRFGDYDLDRLVPLAASVELLHSATLVHDDVIDNAATRRGRADRERAFENVDHGDGGRLHVRPRRRAGRAHRQHRRHPALRPHADEMANGRAAPGPRAPTTTARRSAITSTASAARRRRSSPPRRRAARIVAGQLAEQVGGAAGLRRQLRHGVPDRRRHPRLHRRRGGDGQARRQRPHAGHVDPALAAADRALAGQEPRGSATSTSPAKTRWPRRWKPCAIQAAWRNRSRWRGTSLAGRWKRCPCFPKARTARPWPRWPTTSWSAAASRLQPGQPRYPLSTQTTLRSGLFFFALSARIPSFLMPHLSR